MLSTVTSLGQLSSYKPTKSMLWSLPVSTTYFGIYGRAPRWASHLGTDYHGTWLPQTVRRRDNRSERFYIPVGFQLLRTYIDNGFDINELIVKRQRHCQAYGLGTYLSLQYNFLVFTHEYIVTFRKVPKIDQMAQSHLDNSCCTQKKYYCCYYNLLPNYRLSKLYDYSKLLNLNLQDVCKNFGFDLRITSMSVEPISMDREKVALETVWQIKVDGISDKVKSQNYKNLLVIKIVQRFGQDYTNWEFFDVTLLEDCCDDGLRLKNLNNEDNIRLLLSVQKNCILDNDIQISGDESEDFNSFSENEVASDNQILSHGKIETYEQKRQRQIEENQKKLLSLGLISEFGIFNKEKLYSESLALFDKKKLLNQDKYAEYHQAIINDQYSEVLDNNSCKSQSDKDEKDFKITSSVNLTDSRFDTINNQSGIKKTKPDKIYDSLDMITPKRPPFKPAPISLIVIPHVETINMFTKFKVDKNIFSGIADRSCIECQKYNLAKTVIDSYRMLLVQMVLQSYDRLMINGLIAIGVQDIRDPINYEFWPMGLLITEDIGYAISSENLKLKELIIAIPTGFENVKESSQYRVNGKTGKFDSDKLNIKCVLDVPNKEIDHIPIAPGTDELPSEIWKLVQNGSSTDSNLARLIYKIIDLLYSADKIPPNWTTSIFVPVPKRRL
ncbi:hypothetical protein BB561_003842 [Smittium simulii]|uniref:Uncharacterized protein n=1 Tax=Smittium simulii TaxID=133385 RepID=A0A2T9YJ79_9FUNG|nr:hypothetical protein BB561_003842 [Smittium simulii]